MLKSDRLLDRYVTFMVISFLTLVFNLIKIISKSVGPPLRGRGVFGRENCEPGSKNGRSPVRATLEPAPPLQGSIYTGIVFTQGFASLHPGLLATALSGLNKMQSAGLNTMQSAWLNSAQSEKVPG